MAWFIEKGTGDLVINGFEKGIAENPYDGIQDLRNVNIGTVPGEVSVGFGLTTSTVTGATLGIPVSRATKISSGVATGYYILDADGHVFTSSSISGTWTYLSSGASTSGASANDVVFCWKGYVFKTRGTAIDYYSGGTWTNGWNPSTGGSGASGIVTGDRHPTIVGQDDVVYICNGKNIISLLEKTSGSFDPTNTATYTFNASALALPSYEVAQSLAELGTKLLVGGTQNAIYPWDRISPSYNSPIFCADSFIRLMVTANNNVFIFPGNTTGRGRIYITNGSQIEVFFKIPDHLSGYQEPYYKFYDAIYHRNSIVFGFENNKNSDGSVITGTTSNVWAIDCTDNSLRSISTVTGGSAAPRVLIPDTAGLSVSGYAYIIGYSDGSSHGIGYSGTTAGIGTATVISDRIPVGTFLKKKTFSNVEFKLGYPLQSGESIVLSYISDLTNSGTIATFTSADTNFANYTGVNFEKSQWLQIQAVLTGNSAISGCRLREIRLR